MRDNRAPEGCGPSVADWLGGLAKEALEQLASLQVQKAEVVEPELLQSLVSAILDVATDDSAALMQLMVAQKVKPEVLATLYIPEAARALGTGWNEDRLSFVEVTIGTARLESLLHELGPHIGVRRAAQALSVLILVPQAEQHTLGAYVLALDLRRAGHEVAIRIAPTAAELTQVVHATRFDRVLISVACQSGLMSSAAMIKTLRLVARSPLRVLVVGAIDCPDVLLLDATGADCVARDISSALADFAEPDPGEALDRGEELKAKRAGYSRIERGSR